MKKYLNLFWVALAIILCVALVRFNANARITGTSSDDVWCVGPDGAEVCVDSSGNFLPTTTNDATLGTSSLYWNRIYVTSAAVTNMYGALHGNYITNLTVDSTKIKALSIDSEKLGPGSVNSEKLGTNSVIAAKILALVIDSTKMGVASVDAEKLASNAVITAKVAALAIDTTKIAVGAVDTSKILSYGTPDTGKVVCMMPASKALGYCTVALIGATCGACTPW